MNSPVTLFDLKIDALTMQEVLSWMAESIRQKEVRMICTLNAALLVWSTKEPYLKETYANADLVVADSFVVYYALKLLRRTVPEPLAACRVMFEFVKSNFKKGYRFYFLGAKPEVLVRAIENIQKEYPGIHIAGSHHGYFNKEEEKEVVRDIIRSAPDCLFVGMSTPLKEKFLREHLPEMKVPVALGVGGGIDIYAGEFKLAPRWMQKLGLEWFYRLCSEPRRMWKRYLVTNTQFLWLLLGEVFKRTPKPEAKGTL